MNASTPHNTYINLTFCGKITFGANRRLRYPSEHDNACQANDTESISLQVQNYDSSKLAMNNVVHILPFFFPFPSLNILHSVTFLQWWGLK